MGRRHTSRLSLAFLGGFVAILYVFIGCVPDVTPTELHGRWEMTASGVHEVLELRSDRTFTHSIAAYGSRSPAVGTWNLIGVDRAPRVILKYERDFEGHRSGASINVVRTWTGRLELATDPDARMVYQKV
jgi:hypothetical protein